MSTKFSPSPKQAAAIQALGKNILVSASAGAGKTTVLINRLIKRMEMDHVSISRILSVTFTELAAKEMRKRLEKNLNERVEETHDPFLKAQISLLASAQVTTIHGFCLDLLKKYAYVVDFDPQRAQNVLDETMKTDLMNQAFQNVLENTSDDQFEARKNLMSYFSANPENFEILQKNVIKLANKLLTIVDPQAWIERSITAYDSTSFIGLTPELQHYARLYYLWKIDNLINLANYTINDIKSNSSYKSLLIRKNDDKDLQSYFDHVMTLIFALTNAREDALKLDYKNLRLKVIGFVEGGLISPPLVSKDGKVYAAVNKLKDDCKALTLELFEEEDWFMDHGAMKPIVEALAQLTQRFQHEYARLKVVNKAIDFDDMEHFALEILRNRHFNVKADLKKHYEEILVDEFQDTNFIQNEIVELLSSGLNVFRVGDVKQSIYRFRNAQPEMMQAMKSVQDEMHQVLYLTENYRSTKNIVDFNNILFDRLMNFAELESTYTQGDHVDAGRKSNPDTQARVEFHFLEKNETDENIILVDSSVGSVNFDKENDLNEEGCDSDEIDRFAEPLEDVQPKAVHIANEIENMRRTTPFKNYRDYVVLVRSNTIKEQIKTVFEKARIPHHISIKSGFFNSDAVQDVLLMINFLVNPTENINFIGLLFSDFIGYSENQVAELKLVTDKYQAFSDSIEKYDQKTAHQLKSFRDQLSQSDLIETLREIYAFNMYYDRYCSIQQRANLDLLSEKAQLYAKQNIARTQFLLLLKKVTEEDSSEAIPYTDEDDVVRVMTIHASKGLEFKVVFFWSQGKSQIMDLKEQLLIDSELGFSLKTLVSPKRFVRTNPIRLAIEMKTVRDDVQEQVRLLYVALTRAEERLIIVDKMPTNTFTNLHYTNILNSLGPTTWMFTALREHASFERKTIPSPTQLLMHNPPLNVEEELRITQKSTAEVVFRAPSSTHKIFTHFKLNFDTNIGSNHGTLIHELFEKLPTTGVTEAMVRELQPDIDDKDLNAIMYFYNHELYKQCTVGEIKHEYPFYALVDQEVIHGYMDMVAFTDTATILIDFKTDRVDDRESLIELYRDQLKDYALVLSRIRPEKPVRAYMYALALSAFIEIF